MLYTVLFVLGIFTQDSMDKLKFEHINVKDGLSQSSVFDIHQDRNGFLWFATEDGLNKYDGYKFKVFRHIPFDTTSVSNSFINAVTEDSLGYLWVGTKNGLNRFNQQTEKFEQISLLNHYTITVLKYYKDTLWVGTPKGLFKVSQRTKAVVPFVFPEDSTSPKSEFITDIVFDRNDRIYVTTDNEFVRYNLSSRRYKRILHNYPFSKLHIDKSNYVWIGSIYNQFIIYDPDHDKTTYDLKNLPIYKKDSYSAYHLHAITEVTDDYLWFGTNKDGLYIYDKKSERNYHYTMENGLSSNRVESIYKDQNGIIWIGTYGGGLSKYDPFQIQSHSIPSTKAMNNDFIWGIYELQNKSMLIGTNTSGLYHFQPEKKTYTRIKDPKGILLENPLNSILQASNNNVYVSSQAYGLLEFNFKDKSLSRVYPKEKNEYLQLSRVIEDTHGNLWLISYDGIFIYNLKSGKTKKAEINLPSKVQTDIMTAIKTVNNYNETIFWFGTESHGLYQYNLERNTYNAYIYNPEKKGNTVISNQIFSLETDNHHNIWVGTNNGLSIFNTKNSKFYNFYEKDGLPSVSIFSMLKDEHGHIWISTTNGLSRASLNPNDFHINFENFDQRDGFVNIEYNQNSAHIGYSGNLYFGGTKGVDIIDPKAVKTNPYNPRLIITEIATNTKTHTLPDCTAPLVFNSSTNVVEFNFVALNYSNPQSVKYAYMLEGFDERWVYSADKRNVRYTNLNGGQYIFKVKTVNNNGLWNESSTEVPVHIKIEFWKTPTFFISMFIMFLLLIFLYRYRALKSRLLLENIVDQRTLQLRSKNLELREAQTQIVLQKENLLHINHDLETALDDLKHTKQLKESIVEMIVHDIKNPLNTILSFSDPTQDISQFNPKICKTVNQSANQILNLVINLLESSKFDNGQFQIETGAYNLHKLADDSIQQVIFVAEQKSNRILNNIPEEMFVDCDAELITRVFVNILTNGIKYSPFGSEIIMHALREDECITISIIDFGQGIPEEKIGAIFGKYVQVDKRKSGTIRSSGIGLNFCKIAVEAHQHKIWVESEPKMGTSFFFQLSETSPTEHYQLEGPSAQGSNGRLFVELSIDAYQQIKPHLLIIKKLDIYDTSDIISQLKHIRSFKFRQLDHWCNELENAVFNSNHEKFKELIHLVEYEQNH